MYSLWSYFLFATKVKVKYLDLIFQITATLVFHKHGLFFIF